MNDDQAYRIRIIQYLLSKGDFLVEELNEYKRRLKRKNAESDEYLDCWLAMVKLECWQEFAADIWKLIK